MEHMVQTMDYVDAIFGELGFSQRWIRNHELLRNICGVYTDKYDVLKEVLNSDLEDGNFGK